MNTAKRSRAASSARTATPWILECDHHPGRPVEFNLRTSHGIDDPTIATMINPGANLLPAETPTMRAEANGEFIVRAVNAHDRLVALVRHCLATLNMSDAEHPDFADSGSDTVEHFWALEHEIKALAKELNVSP